MCKLNFNNIEQIKQHRFVGNAYSDQAAFNAIHDFVMNDNNSVADRAEALRFMSDEGMGCGRDDEMSDAEVLASYVDHM